MTHQTHIAGASLCESFVEAMAPAATGVTIVGAADASGPSAQTVSAMCSASADPPMVLACISAKSPLNGKIHAAARFSVSVLATWHDHVADTFAGRPWPGKDRWDFTCGEWTTASSGNPILADALAWFDCELAAAFPAGSHVVYIGLVTQVGAAREGEPLAYSRHAYARLSPIVPSEFEDFPLAHPENRAPTPRHVQSKETAR